MRTLIVTLAVFLMLALVGCKTIPVYDDQGNQIGEQTVADEEKIAAVSGTASLLVQPPWDTLIGPIAGVVVAGIGAANRKEPKA